MLKCIGISCEEVIMWRWREFAWKNKIITSTIIVYVYGKNVKRLSQVL